MTVLTLGLLPIMSGGNWLRHRVTDQRRIIATIWSFSHQSDHNIIDAPETKNIESLHTPKLNTVLQISDVGAKRRDRHFGLLHEQVGCALEILNLNLNDCVEVPRSNLMSNDKQGKMGRRKMYEQLSDATRLLASHKDISQHRRESLRPALNKDYRVICTTQQYAKLTSNEFLFGVDLSKRTDEALKAKRLANKLAGSNVA